MKNPYVRVITINIIQILLLAVMFLSGFYTYVQSTNLYTFGIAGIGGSVIALSITLLFYKFIDKQPLQRLRFTCNRKHVLFSLSSIVLTVGLYLLYYMLLSQNGIITAQFPSNYFANPNVIPMFIVTALAWFFVGLSEEVLYRGYFVANFKHVSPGKLFLISSILFMVSHVFKGLDLVYIVFLVGMGMTFLYMYVKTGSLLATAIPHFIYDFVNNQLIGDSDISILQVIDGKLSDVHGAILLVLFIVLHIILVQVFFRDNVNKSLNKFSQAISD